MTTFLMDLLIGVLVYWLGEKVIGLVKNAQLAEILNIILIIVVVLFVIFGTIPFIK
jgi:Na+-driven multidrug efflux pump